MGESREITFRRMFDAHYGPVMAYARRRGASFDDAHDVATETLMVAWRRLDDVPEGEGERPWLLATARRVLANQRRSARRRRGLLQRLRRVAPSGPVDAPAPGSPAAPRLEDAGLAAALATLEEDDREILRLVAWDGLSHAQVGDLLGITESAVSSRVQRARERLRRALDEQLEDEPRGV